MLSPQNRLRDGALFRAAYRHGVRAGSATIVVHSVIDHARTDEDETRSPLVGFVVSKKVSMRAVVRNRIKRQLRHLMRDRIDALPQSSITVVRALPGIVDVDRDRMIHDLDRCLSRVARAHDTAHTSAPHENHHGGAAS